MKPKTLDKLSFQVDEISGLILRLHPKMDVEAFLELRKAAINLEETWSEILLEETKN